MPPCWLMPMSLIWGVTYAHGYNAAMARIPAAQYEETLTGGEVGGFMYDRSDGCLLILLSVGGAFLLTPAFFATVTGNTPSGAHRGSLIPLALFCVGAWVFVFGIIVAEAIHAQRRPRP